MFTVDMPAVQIALRSGAQGPNQARSAGLKIALSNSFGFGGHNTALVLKAIE
jgi:3-oxoacyl-(acyl-carrier-protein) synthase